MSGIGSPAVGQHHNGSGEVYMAHKISKLQHVVGYEVISHIFNGCYIFVNGYTDPPRNEVRRLVTMHGGNFDSYQTSRTTHIICDIFPNTKIINIRKNHKIKIYYVTMSWLLTSIEKLVRESESSHLPKGIKGYLGNSIESYATTTSSNSTISIQSSDIKSNNSTINLDMGEFAPSDNSIDQNSASTSLADTSSAIARNPDIIELNTPHSPLQDNSTSDNSVMHSSIQSPQLYQDVQHSFPSPGSYPPPVPKSPQFNDKLVTSKSSLEDPNFVKHFFESSRLHFIGSWRSRLPQLISSFDPYQPSDPLPNDASHTSSKSAFTDPKCIVHIDMDCFFVSVLIRDK
jgi:DNA repair protein REV1